MKRFVVAAALLATVAVISPASPVRAMGPSWTTENNNLTITSTLTRGVLWPKCSTDAQEYCWEVPSVITPDGVETVIAAAGTLQNPGDPNSMFTGTPYTYCHDNDITSRAACKMDGSDWLEVQLTGNYTETESKNTYRWKLRLGTFAPDMLSLGDTQKSVVGGSAADGWTIEMWVKPALFAYRDNCQPPTCGQNDKADRVWYTVQGHLHQMPVGATNGMGSSSQAQRDALRGVYISTNASTQSWMFGQDTFKVTASSPHFLPDGVTPTPGFVKVWLPPAYVLKDRGYTDINQVKPEFFDLKVSDMAATAKVSIYNGGLLVDTGVEHYSSPNPTVKLKSATETMASQNLAVLSSNNSASSTSSTGSGSYFKTVVSGVKASITVTLASAGTFTVYRKVGSKLTLVKKVSGKKGANKVITSYLKGYSFVVKDSKGKTLAVKTTAVRFAHYY